MDKIKNLVYTEKYRPRTIDDVIGDFSHIKKYLETPQSIPNFLFYSKTPGTGKTSLAKAIIHDLGCDHVTLNSSDERKIDVIREKVKEFAKTRSSNGIRKCVFMDEFDGMLKASQEALRNIMETYSSNVFFILTCNNIHKVVDALQSRCVLVEFTKPSTTNIYEYLSCICANEGIKFNEESLRDLIQINYPSIRNAVKVLQDANIREQEITPEFIKIIMGDFDDYWKLIEQQKFDDIRQIILKERIDCEELNKWIFYHVLDASLELKKKIKIIQICARNERDFTMGVNKDMMFIASLPEIIMGLK